MTDLVTNFAEMGATGPSYPGDATHSTEWFFDLDAELVSGKDVAYIDYDKSGVRTAIRETTLGKEVYINGSDVYQVKNGIQLYNTGESYIYDFSYIDVESTDIYGQAIRIGGGATSPTVGNTYIKNVFGDGLMAPLTSYSSSNTDFIAIELYSAPVYLQYVTAKNFSDAIIDNKSVIYIMNATFEDAHRVLRVWDNAEVIIVNSELSTVDGQKLLWLAGPNSKISYYNVTWNGQDHPDLSMISYNGGLTATTAMSRIVELTENPLPALSSFFATEIATVDFEYSLDGHTWVALSNGSFGSTDLPLRGDVRFDLDLPAGDNVSVRALIETTDGKQALTGAMEFSGASHAVTVDLADFNWGDTGAPIDATTTDPVVVPSGTDPVLEPIPAPSPSDPNFVAAINVGGTQYTATDGTVYAADTGPSSGGPTKTATKSTLQFAGTDDDFLFQSSRYADASSGGTSFTYDIPVSEPGDYLVRLSLADPWWTEANIREFDVSLEGVVHPSLDNIDIVEQAGLFTMLTIEQVVHVVDGVLNISFVSDPTHDKAMAQAIAVYRADADHFAFDDIASVTEGGAVAIDVVSNDNPSTIVQSVGDATHGTTVIQDGKVLYTPDANYVGDDSFTYSAKNASGATDTATVTVSIAPNEVLPVGPQLIAAYNIGGGAYTSDATGISYAADPGQTAGKMTLRHINNAISGTVDDALYQTYGFGKFSYDIAVPVDGEYTVQIELIEPWANNTGKRVFDVRLEGSATGDFDNIDIFEISGSKFTAITLTETVTVTDGVLDMDFIASQNNAIVSAIAVFYEDSLIG